MFSKNSFIKYPLVAIFFLASILGTETKAQSNWGIKVAATTSDFGGRNIAEVSSSLFGKGVVPKLGVTAGVFGELQLIKWLRLRAELNGSWKGSGKHFWLQEDIDLFYLGTPALVEILPAKNLILAGGIEPSLLLASSGPVSSKRLDLGLVFHLEYRFFKRLGLSLRYIHGLKKVNTVNVVDALGNTTSTDLANRSLQLGLSYSFGKFKKCKKRKK